MNTSTSQWVSEGPNDTEHFAASLAPLVSPGTVITLNGNLGAGKTCFVRGFAKASGVDSLVNSPTFTLINEYPGTPPLHHIDLYRLNHPDEVISLGFDEYLNPEGITLLEWPEKAGDLVPDKHIAITIQDSPTDRRVIRICADASLISRLAKINPLQADTSDL